MPAYTASFRATAVHPVLTVKTAVNQMAVLRRAWYSKLGESATAGVIERVLVQRSNGAGVTPTSRTEKHNTRSGANQAAGQSWGTAPTVSGNPLIITDAGDKPSQINSWRPARPWASIIAFDADELSIDSNSVANTSTHYSLTWSENDPSMENRFIRGRRPTRRGLWHYWSSNCGPVKAALPNTVPLQQHRLNWVQYLGRPNFVKRTLNALLLVGGGGGGTTFNQSLTATVNVTATMSLTTLKNLSATVVVTGAFQRQVNKALSATVNTTASIQRQTNKLLSATVSVTGSVVRRVNKTLSATVNVSAAVQALKVVLLTLTATVNVSASISRQTNKAMSATVNVTGSVVKQVRKVLSATVNVSAALQSLKVIVLTLTATVNVSASMSRQTSKVLSATVNVTAGITKRVSKLLSATVNVAGVVNKRIPLLLTATVNVTASMTATFKAKTTAAAKAVAKFFTTKFGFYG